MILDVLSNDTDVDHTPSELTITGVTNGLLGTASRVGTGVRFVPSTGLCGTGSFTYKVEDASGGLSNTATAEIDIACVNTAPIATSDSFTISEDASTTTFDLISNDNDIDLGDTISISGILTTTTHGTLSVSSSTEVDYTPSANFCGIDTFTYQARDSFGPA